MANTGFLSTSELDFASLKQSLKTYLQGQAQFTDFDFDGSNMSVLLDILSYNTYMNNFYLNMIGSEMFLDTAQLKESTVSHAKELNYLPRSKTSAEALVNITINTGLDTPDNIVIPKNYKFTTSVDNTTYNFLVAEDVIVTSNNGNYSSSNTKIYEGSLVTEYFNVTGNDTFSLSSTNIDTRSIDVYVYTSNTSAIAYPYTRATSLYGLTSTSNSFFVTGYNKDQYQITFGNGTSGRALNSGNFIKVEYRDTVGDKGNGAYKFAKTVNIDGYSNVTATTVTTAAYGSEREGINDIKFNAPRFFATQDRAVTASDYITLVLDRFPQFQSVTAYGGEKINPPKYGKVAIACKPYGSIAVLSDSLKQEIIDYLKLKNMTTEPIVVDPDFFYIVVDSSVKYNTSATTLNSNQIKSAVKQAILNYANSYITSFGNDLSYSKLLSEIDASDTSIIGNDTDVLMSKRWSPPTGQSNTTVFSYENEIYHENSLYSTPQGHELAFRSSLFKYQVNGAGTIYNAYAGDNGLGTLKIYTDQTVAGTLTRVTLNETAGSINYITGEVTLTANVFSYTGSHIKLNAKLLNKDIIIDKNTFLLVNAEDINVTTNPIVV
ncbi:baseplate wedge subunit [uncultured Caudovirales phage]|uniref:Baseplate wedge subunit n=1 Tax=uncultured Caudovirales phage TaxID=2100421 RepID=A0A6J7WWD2_9CAUD|nr:baseplate wedge subunit [uncultured Caudovirales phage]